MRILGILMVLFFASASFTNVTEAPTKNKTETITIQTNAVCGSCKDRIEKKLNYTKGVVFAELDLETKKLTVKYKTKQLSADDIKNAVAELGYDAGDVKRDEEAFKKLPACCQSEGRCGKE